MANRVTGRGNPKNTVLKSITSKLQKIDAEMKAAKVDEIRANTRVKHSTADQQDQEFLQKDLGMDKQHEMNMENLKGQQTMEQSALDHLMAMKQMNAQTKNTEK